MLLVLSKVRHFVNELFIKCKCEGIFKLNAYKNYLCIFLKFTTSIDICIIKFSWIKFIQKIVVVLRFRTTVLWSVIVVIIFRNKQGFWSSLDFEHCTSKIQEVLNLPMLVMLSIISELFQKVVGVLNHVSLACTKRNLKSVW